LGLRQAQRLAGDVDAGQGAAAVQVHVGRQVAARVGQEAVTQRTGDGIGLVGAVAVGQGPGVGAFAGADVIHARAQLAVDAAHARGPARGELPLPAQDVLVLVHRLEVV